MNAKGPPTKGTTDPIADRIEYCYRVAGGVRKISQATKLQESLLYRYRKPGASRRTDVLVSIARAAKVSEEWLLSGRDEAGGRPRGYHSRFDLPYLLSAESDMDERARASAIERRMGMEPQIESLREEINQLREQVGRLSGEMEQLKATPPTRKRKRSTGEERSATRK